MKGENSNVIKYGLIIIAIICVGVAIFINVKFSPSNTTPHLRFITDTTIKLESDKTYHAIEFIESHANIAHMDFPEVKKQLGKQVLIYKVIGKDQSTKIFSLEIEMVDATAPTIFIKNQTLTYEYEQSIPTAFNDNIEVKDNYSFVDKISVKTELPATFNVGENVVTVKACDEYTNCSQTQFKVVKKEKKVEENNVVKNSSLSQNKQPIKTPTIPPKPRTPTPTATSKKFLFTEGYNMKNVYQACYNHLISIGSGECIPLKKGDTYTGYEYKP